VAKPNYEDMFCMGQHAMKDTGACVVKSAYSTVPVDVMTQDLAVPPVHMRHAPVKKRRHA
jgi:hypothetical protein